MAVFSGVFLFDDQAFVSLAERNVFDNNQYLFAEQSKISLGVDLNITSGAVFNPSAPPFLVSGKALGAVSGIIEPEPSKEISRYIVEEGDTLASLAEKFNVSLDTLLYANNLSSSSLLKIGQELMILPISGVMHIVMERDTVSEIAELYGIKVQSIIEFNELEDEGRIYAGDILIVPGGKKPKVLQQYTQVPLSNSYFICPIPAPCRITQGLHWFNAIDFSNGKCGEPVFAAAGGAVQRAGSTSLGGNYVRIAHPNGVVTYYGHLSKFIVSAGAKVYQGQIIGYIGYSGVTAPAGPAGCHLHFDVRFAENPFRKYTVGANVAN